MASFVHLIDQRRLIGPGGSTVSGDIYFYYTGTSVLAPVYQDASMTIPSPNPVSVGAGEIVPQLFLDDAIVYRRVILYSDGTLDEQDPLGSLFTEGELGLPVGSVIDYSGPTAPEGFMFCFGQAISRSVYSDLFDAVGTTYGSGNGTTTFNIPDYRGRVGAGKDNMGGVAAGRLTDSVVGSTLGAVGGEQNHQLTEGELPSHSHGITDPGHTHLFKDLVPGSGVGSGTFRQGGDTPTSSSVTGITINETGSDQSHNNVQPTIVTNKIIKVTPVTFLSLLGITPDFTGKANASAIGIAPTATSMGTFGGGILPDDSTVKNALQVVSDYVEDFQTRLASTTALNGPNLVGWFHDTTTSPGSLARAWRLHANPMNAPWSAAGDGVTDDTAKLQACLDWLKTFGGGVMDLTHKHLISSANLTVPRYVSMRMRLGTGSVGNPSFFGHTNAFADMAAAPKLIVSSSYSVIANSTGGNCSFENIIFGRQGLAYNGNDDPVNYAGTAVILTTTSGITLKNCTFLGFAKGVFSDGSSQIRWEYCQFDGLNSTHQRNGFDINTHLDCRSYNFLQSGITGNTDPRTKRDGTAYLCDGTGNGGHQFINTFAYGYRKAFSMETQGSYSFPGCWADGGKDAVTGKSYWSDGIGFNLISGNTSNNAEIQIVGVKIAAQNTGIYIGPNMYGATLISDFHAWECTETIKVEAHNVQIRNGAIRGHFSTGITYVSSGYGDSSSVTGVRFYDRQGSPNTPVEISCSSGSPYLHNVDYYNGVITIINYAGYTVTPVSEMVTYQFNREVIFVAGTGIVGDAQPKIVGKVITFIFDSDAVTTFGGPDGASTFYNDIAAGNFSTRGPFKATAGSSITFYRNKANTKWVELSRTLFNQSSDPSIRVVSAAGAVTVAAYENTVVVNKTTGAATTVNLFASPMTGKRVTIKDGKGDAATNNITVTPAAGNIDGAANSVINTNYGSRTFIYNGTQWNVI